MEPHPEPPTIEKKWSWHSIHMLLCGREAIFVLGYAWFLKLDNQITKKAIQLRHVNLRFQATCWLKLADLSLASAAMFHEISFAKTITSYILWLTWELTFNVILYAVYCDCVAFKCSCSGWCYPIWPAAIFIWSITHKLTHVTNVNEIN